MSLEIASFLEFSTLGFRYAFECTYQIAVRLVDVTEEAFAWQRIIAFVCQVSKLTKLAQLQFSIVNP